VLLCLNFAAAAPLTAAENQKNPVCVIKSSSGDIRVELFAADLRSAYRKSSRRCQN